MFVKKVPIVTDYVMAMMKYKTCIETTNNFPAFQSNFFSLVEPIDIDTYTGKTMVTSVNPQIIFKEFQQENTPDTIYFFIGWSKKGGGMSVGSACHSEQILLSVIRQINSLASIYTAERTAIRVGLEYICRQNI